MNKIQDSVFKMLKKVICDSIEAVPLEDEVIEITTPFIDWKGGTVSIYLTKEGRITDGDQIINQLKSLRVIDEFEVWPFQKDFFYRYQIQKIENSLEPSDAESPEGLLSYIQGISRIPSFFKPNPISSPADNYRAFAIEFTKTGLKEKYTLSDLEVLEFASPRSIDLKDGISIINDFSPKNKNFIFKIISHASASSSAKDQHVRSKVLDPILWKQENHNAYFCAILDSVDDYPPISQNLLGQKADIIIETRNPKEKDNIARLLVEQ